MREVGADEEVMMPVHGPFVNQGFVSAPGTADLGVHDDFGMREENVEVEGSMFIFVTKVVAFVVSFFEGGVDRFEVNEGLVDWIDEVL